MGYRPHLSRREILDAIPLLPSGGLLLPMNAPAAPAPQGVIRGALRDAATGRPVAVKMRVTSVVSGDAFMPVSCVRSMPKKSRSGVRYFYARGAFELAVPEGSYSIEVVRGICHQPEIAQVDIAAGGVRVRDFSLKLLWDLHASGWYSGNTHTHFYMDIEESVDERLRIVPPAEDVDVSVISYLIRNEQPFASNRIPIGRLPQFSRDGALLDMGEECRNNSAANSIPFGYGHCLFLNIPRLVQPVSTGMLSPDGRAPDFPTVSMLCAEARKLGGTTVWCHNGHGLEAPVAVALGLVNAANIADGFPVEYEGYYRFLNCGLRLPISSGTDWWEYDHNRVFARVESKFSYETWLAGLRAGRTFVSNGPLLGFEVNGQGPGSEIKAGARVRVLARALSRVPFERLEIVRDGEVVASQPAANNQEARIEQEIPVPGRGWIAARVSGATRTRLGYPVFAHTGPVYLDSAAPASRRAEAARAVIAEIDKGIDFIRKNYRFARDADRAIALGRFDQGRRRFAEML